MYYILQQDKDEKSKPIVLDCLTKRKHAVEIYYLEEGKYKPVFFRSDKDKKIIMPYDYYTGRDFDKVD